MSLSRIFVPARNAEDWKPLLAEPDKHWKTGYSARALAHCWHDQGGFPASIRSLFSTSPGFADIEPLIVIPEHQVPLPGGSRPSQNDLWVLARGQSRLISIAVEGKVSEPFGPTVGEWMENASMGKQERLKYLCELLRLDYRPPLDVRYQLLHRTASALLEARRFYAAHAMMIVHSFSQSDEWFDDFARFATILGALPGKSRLLPISRHSSPSLHIGWVSGEERYLRA